jgi:hypothetical protein
MDNSLVRWPFFGGAAANAARERGGGGQCLTDRYDANFCANFFPRDEKILANRFAWPLANLLFRRRCACGSLINIELERRNTKRRLGLVRVLYFFLGGRGRMPTNTWPFVNRICVPGVSVFDPPTYVVASLRKRSRVSERLVYVKRRESQSRQPARANSKASDTSMAYIGRRPRMSFRIIPR